VVVYCDKTIVSAANIILLKVDIICTLSAKDDVTSVIAAAMQGMSMMANLGREICPRPKIAIVLCGIPARSKLCCTVSC